MQFGNGFDDPKEPPNSLEVPWGWMEDTKKFTIAAVDATVVTKQLTELISARVYIIKEIRFFISSNPAAAADDAYFHVSRNSADAIDAERFIEGYYYEGSFCILSGNRNGRLNAVLTAAPYVHITAGTGAAARTVYGSVKYYYR